MFSSAAVLLKCKHSQKISSRLQKCFIQQSKRKAVCSCLTPARRSIPQRVAPGPKPRSQALEPRAPGLLTGFLGPGSPRQRDAGLTGRDAVLTRYLQLIHGVSPGSEPCDTAGTRACPTARRIPCLRGQKRIHSLRQAGCRGIKIQNVPHE